MSNQIKPVFIFSLPRSGSTLLQKIISADSRICSAAEPWILLPLIKMSKEKGTYTEYSHSTSVRAFNDLVQNLDANNISFDKILKNFIKEIYEGLSKKKDCFFFVDKTPRYFLIIDDIYKIFPEAKFIFLFRNPLDVIESIHNTWYQKKFRHEHHYIDIVHGANKIKQMYQKYKHHSFKLRYEDLISNYESEIKRIYSYLGLEFDEAYRIDYSEVNFIGNMGDKKGIKKFKKINKSNSTKYIDDLNIFKYVYYRRYINFLGQDFFNTSGYELETIKNNLNYGIRSNMYRLGIKDAVNCLISRVKLFFNARFQKDNILNFVNCVYHYYE